MLERIVAARVKSSDNEGQRYSVETVALILEILDSQYGNTRQSNEPQMIRNKIVSCCANAMNNWPVLCNPINLSNIPNRPAIIVAASGNQGNIGSISLLRNEWITKFTSKSYEGTWLGLFIVPLLSYIVLFLVIISRVPVWGSRPKQQGLVVTEEPD